MKFRELVASAAAVALSAAPAFAQEASRTGNNVADASQFGGDSTLLLILAVLLIGSVVALAAGNNRDTPSSP